METVALRRSAQRIDLLKQELTDDASDLCVVESALMNDARLSEGALGEATGIVERTKRRADGLCERLLVERLGPWLPHRRGRRCFGGEIAGEDCCDPIADALLA